MQVIYAFPFILISFAAFILCLAVRRWRRFIIHAVIIPPAFAISSIIGMFSIVLIANGFGHPLPGLEGNLLLLLIPIYLAPGIIGAWLAYRIINAILRRLGFSNGYGVTPQGRA